MSRPYDPETLKFYATSAEEYVYGRPEGPSRHLPAFLGLLPKPAHILDLGCGGGMDAEAMISAGFTVDPSDGVAEIAAIASERLGQKVRVLRFDELDADQAYDGIWANASLHHAPRAELPGLLKRIHTALKPGGLHFANFKSGKPDGRDARNRLYSYLSLDEMTALYRGAGDWDIVSAEAYTGGARYETDDTTPWVKITARRLR